ncbi:tetratricopeptide repeat protein [Streptomyces europaeiscabiei]|uniref:tetratricopeptide repeat protein n=1 Tax=Streptomyces europaeiscabiei TaxID=146819 RepID=UPI000E6A8B40|nr:tetratricopeptide repeat protein [Streptomyces europaeiscabiei]
MAEADSTEEDAGGRVSNRITDGVFLHAVVQGRDITVVLPAQITPALAGLPIASATFTGREAHLDQMLKCLAPDQVRQQPVVAVAGLAGVGKTELVVQAATRALEMPGWFPGGVLFVDLFGYDRERRLSPERALVGLLRALGIPGEYIPADLQDRSRLYRSALAAFAEQGRRVLVVLDNASTAEQARPLLPTDGTTAVLLTSRHTLDVDARLHDLAVLDEDASVELLCQALHRARGPADSRVADDPGAAAAIARLCAGLPLALRIAAALLADMPARPLTSLADALQAEHSRLDRLRREDRAVRAAFDLSYRHIDDLHARLFRLLPLNPGPDLSTETAAHLTDADQVQVEELLQDLARGHLIEPGHTWGRWRLHDLVRLYADEHGRAHADTDRRDTALTRLHDHYMNTTLAADTHLYTPGTASPHFSGPAAALAWLDDERDNLVATVTKAPALGRFTTSATLAFALARYLNYCRAFNDWIDVATTALTVIRGGSGDRRYEAMALMHLGLALTETRRFEEAIDHHTRAAAVFRTVGDRDCEAMALNNLGLVLRQARRFEGAIEAHTAAATIFREIGDRHLEGTALNNLGTALQQVGRFEDAIEAHTKNLAICRELGDRYREGTALTNLGGALLEARHVVEAIASLTTAATIFRETGHRHHEAGALGNLGLALLDVWHLEEAIASLTKAATIFRETGDRHREGMMLGNLGLALRHARRLDEAIEAHMADLALCRELGDRHGEGKALDNLGLALRHARRLDEAIEAHTKYLAICRELDDRHGEDSALWNQAIAHNTLRLLRHRLKQRRPTDSP